MPVEVAFTPDGAGAIVIGTGMVTSQELLSGDKQVYFPEERLRRLKYMLNDYRRTTSTSVTESDLVTSIQNDMAAAKINPGLVVAVVAEEDLIFGMSRMWETLADVYEVQFKTYTTRSLDDAKAWIKEQTGIDVDYAD
ncbi:hypothetical protein JW859_04220 [bacterium]|nr:hypothetical protein [bacterium]